MPGNRIRHLDALLGVDAWHKKPTAETTTMTLHVRLNFNEGRLGGKDDENIQFKIRLKSAELTIKPTDRVKFHPGSPLERNSLRTVHKTAHQSSSKSIELGGKAEAGASQSGPAGKFSLRACGGHKRTSNEDFRTESEMHAIDVRYFSDNSGNPCWLIAPSSSDILDGSPWDANKEPIIKMRDSRQNIDSKDPVEIHILLKCRREDLHIFDIRYKAENGKWFNASDTDERKQLLAIEFIKKIISDIGLSIDPSSSDHSIITLCDLYSEPIIDSEWDNDRQ